MLSPPHSHTERALTKEAYRKHCWCAARVEGVARIPISRVIDRITVLTALLLAIKVAFQKSSGV